MMYLNRLKDLTRKKNAEDSAPQERTELSEDQAFLRESFAGVDGYQTYITQAYNWRLISIFEAIGLVLAIFVLLYVGGQNRFVPYVITLVPNGNEFTLGVHSARYASSIDDVVVKATIKQFIVRARSIVNDGTIENFNINSGTYPMLSGQARSYIDNWYQQDQYQPFARMQNGTVDVDVTSIVRTGDMYTATWREILYDKVGTHPHVEDWEASIGISFRPPANEPAYDNPLGLYITTLNWTKKM